MFCQGSQRAKHRLVTPSYCILQQKKRICIKESLNIIHIQTTHINLFLDMSRSSVLWLKLLIRPTQCICFHLFFLSLYLYHVFIY